MAERDGEEIKHGEPGELPTVEAPPLSPAGASSQDADEVADDGLVPPLAEPPARNSLSRRYQRRATLAAWVALVAGLGALFGGAISNGLANRSHVDVATLEQRQAMQQSIEHLTKQVSALKASLAAATAATHSQIAKISARVDRDPNPEVTGSIPPARVTPVPLPRPAPAHRGRHQPAGGGA